MGVLPDDMVRLKDCVKMPGIDAAIGMTVGWVTKALEVLECRSGGSVAPMLLSRCELFAGRCT